MRHPSTDRGAGAIAELRATFGFDGFRPLQEEIVTAIMGGRDALVLMPTGGGKSLCYQLPALLLDGVTVVVSPLIALMKDQVDKLLAMGVAAIFINSSLESGETSRRVRALKQGQIKLLYVAPERLMLPHFLEVLQSLTVNFFAIDEAHCISEWGHDFRPEYRELKRLRTLFPEASVAAFTATATRRVQTDIVAQLGLQQAVCFTGSFNRANLYYEVRPKDNAFAQLAGYLRDHEDESGIIYCATRATTEQLAEKLRKERFQATAYHGGLESDDRRLRQEAFVRDDVRIMVATIAFGMGIDKPDVRFVVHYDLPKNLEGYYQESGRAGRDGEPSECLLFYSYADALKHEHFIREKSSEMDRRIATQQLRQMANWAEDLGCRRAALLAYFDERLNSDEEANGEEEGDLTLAVGHSFPLGKGEDDQRSSTRISEEQGKHAGWRGENARHLASSPERCCDNCREPAELVDFTIPAQMFLSCVKKTRERFGSAHLIDVLRGSQSEKVLRFGHDAVSTYGIGKDRPQEEWQYLARQLLRGGYAQQDEQFGALKVTELGYAVLFKGEPVVLPRPRLRPSRPKKEKRVRTGASSARGASGSGQPSTFGAEFEAPPADEQLFQRLRTLRKRLADARGFPPYVIFHDATLRQMATLKPTSRDALRRVQGVGEKKLADYGDAFLEVLVGK